MPGAPENGDADAEGGARDGGDPDGAAGPGVADSDARGPDGPAAPHGEEVAGGLERRTLIRLLVGLGIGVPILIEAGTLLGLLDEQFGGGGEDTETPTGTPAGRRVGEGDELLPATAPADTVETAYVGADGWTLTMVVAVENDTDRTYELRLRTVTTADGTTVEGGGSTDPIPPGESGTATGRWDLPEGSTPETVDVFAVSRNGDSETVEETVRLGRVPVRGGE